MNSEKIVGSLFRAVLRTSRYRRRIQRSFSNDRDVEEILRRNEDEVDYERGLGVQRLYANQVGSHSPIQDAWGEARLLHSDGVMFGVFDGNNGTACSHVVAKRIFRYVAVSLLPREVLRAYVRSAADRFRHLDTVTSLQDKHFFLEEYRPTYERSLHQFAADLLREERDYEVGEALVRAYERLDSDLSREAKEDTTPDKRMLWVGMTGTCGTVVHLAGRRLTTAIAGDALVVVGGEGGAVRVLTPEHNVENAAEVARLEGEHPGERLLTHGLLLGSLTSFRSFGNFRYKWRREEVEEHLVPVYGREVLLEQCLSPPYVTARPDVGQYLIRPEDRFVVIASDGIWDIFPPGKELMKRGRRRFRNFILSDRVSSSASSQSSGSQVTSIKEEVVDIISRYSRYAWLKNAALLPARKAQRLGQILRKEPEREEAEVFGSPATQLINEALVQTSKRLHLPRRYIRNIRDDMTVVVVFLDRELVEARCQDNLPLKKRSRVRVLVKNLRTLLAGSF